MVDALIIDALQDARVLARPARARSPVFIPNLAQPYCGRWADRTASIPLTSTTSSGAPLAARPAEGDLGRMSALDAG